jgi:Family of unknown function (DUF5681)
MDSLKFGFPGMISTTRVGINSGETAGYGRAYGDGRFGKGNSYRWKPGQSGNPRGRPRKHNEIELWGTILDLKAQLHDIQHRLRPQRDSRFDRFRVFYEYTGNACRSARLAGYPAKTAKSKAYLLARRAKEATPGRA